MARIRAVDGRPDRTLDGPWEMIVTGPGTCAGPDDLLALTDWLPASVPGTAASALRAAGRWSDAAPTPLHGSDIWYRTRFQGAGQETLRFEGLATLSEVWVNGVPVLTGRSMFLAHDVCLDLAGDNVLVIAFRSLAADLARPHKRGRWRPRLATPGALRHARTSLLGFMPGWCPSVDIVGPYRPITRAPARERALVSADLRADAADGTGTLTARLVVAEGKGSVTLRCDGRAIILAEVAPGVHAGTLRLPGIALWWPHTHGAPSLHAVEAEVDGHRFDLGRVGFRSLSLTRTFEAGLSLAVNGVPVFCRGACWTPPDLVALANDRASYAPLLALAREAGMNMLRVGGTMLYEACAFHDLCDELGILVWQDLMLANFDYPADDPSFVEALTAEIEQVLVRLQASPSLCVVGAGSEVQQQAAMLGFPAPVWQGGLAEETLRAAAARLRPDLIVVPNSPSGGDLPFSTDAGVTHYYGIGAYRRPLEDARRADVRFASECLAFANVPEPETLRRAGLLDPASPAWAAAIPCDRGADWTFETIRDHYVGLLFDTDPARLRRDDPERYLMLGRAAVAEVMEATLAEWRRAASPTAGALVWFHHDLAPGAGWGVIDADGRPKSAWYALKRAFRSVQATLSDEGLNGLSVHLHNETAAPVAADLRLTFTDAGGRTVAEAERVVDLQPRVSLTLSSSALLGRFFDAAAAYRFGPATHTLAQVHLVERTSGRWLADAFHAPCRRDPTPRAIGLVAELRQDGPGWSLHVATTLAALFVHVEIEGDVRPCDNWFHLGPGQERRLSLVGAGARPSGRVRAVNGSETAGF